MPQPALYIVSTPIGNLSDFSQHGQDVLSSVSFILCEDTRHSLKLLNHFGIKNHLESLHVHNEKNKINYLIEKLKNSPTLSAAIISDAGTPAVCDPGSYLVAAAHEENIKIIIVPGPCSMTSAVAASGFIQPRTLFSGFLSKNKSEQTNEFKIWAAASPCIAVFFESPKRVLETLKNLVYFFTSEHSNINIDEIEVCISREISKKFEEHKRISLPSAVSFYEAQAEIQGEFVICLNLNKVISVEDKVSLEFAANEAVLKSRLHKIPLKSCCKELAEKYELNSKDIYSIACKLSLS